MAKKIFGWIYSLFIFCFLYVPIFVLMAMSFNESQYNALPFDHSLDHNGAFYFTVIEISRP